MNKYNIILKKILIFILVLIMSGAFIYIINTLFFPDSSFSNFFKSKQSPPPTPKPVNEIRIDTHSESQKPTLHIQKYVTGTFGPEAQRLSYNSGNMILSIPRLDYKGAVLSVDLDAITSGYQNKGFSEEEIESKLLIDMDKELDKGIVLFNQAQLPGAENRNVSIAGHRDFKGMEFYYIDTITDGDLLYLDYEGKTYIYEYDHTFITNDSDWSPIAVSSKSQLTLQSCDPIFPISGKYDRIFVIAYLIDIIDPDLDLSTYGPFIYPD